MAGFDPNNFTPGAAPQGGGPTPAVSAASVQLPPIPVQWTDAVEHLRCFVMVYGAPGTGKTHLISTAPSPFILSAEGGMLTLKKMMRLLGVRFPYWQIDSFDRLKWALDELLKPEYAAIQTVCGDSITELAKVFLRQTKQVNSHGMKAYGEMQEMMDVILTLFRHYPKHVYLTAQEEVYQVEDGLMKAGPSFPGKAVQKDIGYIPDFVFRAEIHTDPNTGQPQFWLRCKATNQHTAKDRSAILQQWEPPNLTEIFGKVLA